MPRIKSDHPSQTLHTQTIQTTAIETTIQPSLFPDSKPTSPDLSGKIPGIQKYQDYYILKLPNRKFKNSQAFSVYLGRMGEKLVKLYNDHAQRNLIACLEKIPTPTVYTPRGLVHSSKSTVDFLGFTLDGQAKIIAIEVKTYFSSNTFPLQEMPDHQRSFLNTIYESNGYSYLALIFKDGFLRLIPWIDIRELSEISMSDSDSYKTKISDYLLNPLSKFEIEPETVRLRSTIQTRTSQSISNLKTPQITKLPKLDTAISD